MNVLPRSVFLVAGENSVLPSDARPIPLSGLPLGSAVSPVLTASQEKPVIPANLPATSPSMTPRVTG